MLLSVASLTTLWLPILASAAAVWITSAIAWMVLPHHAKDFKALPDEKAFDDVIRRLALPPGNYAFPHCGQDRGKMRDPQFQKRWELGPTGTLGIWPKMNMGRNMLLTFLVQLGVSAMIAYLGASVLPAGTAFGHVFRVAGTAGILAHAFAFLPMGIWFCHGPRAMAMNLIDGVLYGLVTGLVFAALWP